jgi:hypothetical protein
VPPQIVAIGGGGFTDAGALTPLDRYLLDLTGRARPAGVLPGHRVR